VLKFKRNFRRQRVKYSVIFYFHIYIYIYSDISLDVCKILAVYFRPDTFAVELNSIGLSVVAGYNVELNSTPYFTTSYACFI